MITDVEISRSLNALATTLDDQRPAQLDVARCQQIVDGALAHERKLTIVPTGAASGQVRLAEDARLIATIEQRDGRWIVEQQVGAGASSWALPQPAHEERRGADA